MALELTPSLRFTRDNVLKVPDSHGGLLGEGGGGTVHLVRHKSAPSKLFAMKTIRLVEGGVPVRVLDELRLHGSMRHPNIAQFLGSEFCARKIFVFLEFVDGGDLFQAVHHPNASRPPLSLGQKVRVFVQCLRAVAHMHSKGVLHRDLKLENVLLTRGLEVKICDFGWAIEAQHPSRRKSECGTVEYMAPEVFDPSPHSAKVDVWALGRRLGADRKASFCTSCSTNTRPLTPVFRVTPKRWCSKAPSSSTLGWTPESAC